MKLDDDFFNAMRMQGHSHVSMPTSPSSVDTNHQQQILAQLKGDDYYVFMIYNKRLDHTIKIYDYANNVMYEDKDVVVSIADDDFDSASFIAESDAKVTRKSVASDYSKNYGYGDTGYKYGSGYYGSDKYGSGSYDQSKQATKTETKSKSNVETKSKSNAGEKPKGKKGRPPKTAPKNSVEPIQTSLSPYYDDHFSKVDWDAEIFGDRFDT